MGYPKLLHLGDQGSARKTEVPCRAAWTADHPLGFVQHFQDVMALHFGESASA